VLPTLFGEKGVLRLLDKSNLQLDMTKLGFERHQLDVFQDCIHRPYGMVLVTGPAGCGKSSTARAVIASTLSSEVTPRRGRPGYIFWVLVHFFFCGGKIF